MVSSDRRTGAFWFCLSNGGLFIRALDTMLLAVPTSEVEIAGFSVTFLEQTVQSLNPGRPLARNFRWLESSF